MRWCGEMVEWNLWLVKTGETPRKPTQIPFRPPRNPHGVTETQTPDPSGGTWASNPRLRKSRYWGETLQFPQPLLWRNEASLVDQWRTMYFPLALWTLVCVSYIVCCRRTGQYFSVLRTRNSDVGVQCATLAHPWSIRSQIIIYSLYRWKWPFCRTGEPWRTEILTFFRVLCATSSS